MPNEDKNIGDSLVLDLRIWWRHVKTLYTSVDLKVIPLK